MGKTKRRVAARVGNDPAIFARARPEGGRGVRVGIRRGYEYPGSWLVG